MAISARWKLNNAEHDLDVTKQTVENAESRARLQIKTSASRLPRGSNRQYAQALHRQADELCERRLSRYHHENPINARIINENLKIHPRKLHSGEYESALVLYHRAATVCPHDSSHGVAARRTAATISSWNNPEKSSTSTRDDAISRVTPSYESTALKARDASRSSDALSIIPDILKNLLNIIKYFDASIKGSFPFLFRYLDSHKRTSNKISFDLRSLTARLTRSKTMLKRINNHADAILKNLKANFNAGKMKTSLKLAEDLLMLPSDLGDSRRHRIPAYRYLSLIHTALGRHDRACSNVAMMVRLSKESNDVVLLSHALVILGRVHLSFGHLEAAARALENLSIHVEHPVPRAWVHHEIGRCHLEMGKYVKGLRKATQCRECAEEANSKKWTFRAGLLRAQCLVMLGRFAGDDSISQTVVPSLSKSILFFFLAHFLSRTKSSARTKL
ncbi:tetratricopeptide repeat protein 25-like [Pogonomyrmex barbatus]|uniref:Tetratricopeptide repeat protein 25-like n=1 Tax=Pogonomyrmex barbatus TaxID=144034 RepID=A0A8N1S6M4_9HYME|nr:tetratricopeptide repeat protein 25-like [Pogonomyrmex barbatus]